MESNGNKRNGQISGEFLYARLWPIIGISPYKTHHWRICLQILSVVSASDIVNYARN